jgi:hypothetical protein
MHPSVCGLRPEYPELLYKIPFGDVNNQGYLTFVMVDSLQPTLRWEAFPRPNDRGKDNRRLVDCVHNVTYDLKIWQVNDLFDLVEIKLVYNRQRLVTPSHKIEHRLIPLTKYFWTIRARFEIDGHTRVTPWGLSEKPWKSGPSPCKLDFIPYPNYYRFTTPFEVEQEGDARWNRFTGSPTNLAPADFRVIHLFFP